MTCLFEIRARANNVPEAYDDTTAFFRRWIIIVFPQEFKEGKY
jgi:phage/plasmid-associated DNA primase